jgi:hypothetical protein
MYRAATLLSTGKSFGTIINLSTTLDIVPGTSALSIPASSRHQFIDTAQILLMRAINVGGFARGVTLPRGTRKVFTQRRVLQELSDTFELSITSTLRGTARMRLLKGLFYGLRISLEDPTLVLLLSRSLPPIRTPPAHRSPSIMRSTRTSTSIGSYTTI